MKLINSSVELLPETSKFKSVERAARTCYKSEAKSDDTEEGAKEFTERMIKNGHYAMLDHAPVYLATNDDSIYEFFAKNPYSSVHYLPNPADYDSAYCYYITTNYRVLVENDRISLLEFEVEPTKFHNRFYSVKFICSRAIANEIVRHRTLGYAQESTRYCNYSNDKFDNEVTFIIPGSVQTNETAEKLTDAYTEFTTAMSEAEKHYLSLIDQGWKPQQARDVLPLATKTELVATGPISSWMHFFELRCAPSAHPDIQALAKDLYKQMFNREWSDDTITTTDDTKESESGSVSTSTVDSDTTQG